MNAKSLSLATAVALLFISGGFVAHADNKDSAAQVRCFGINSARGKVLGQRRRTRAPAKTPARVKDGLGPPRQECSAKGGRVLPDKGD